MKAGTVKKTPDNSESDSDLSEWLARYAESLSTPMNQSQRISSHSSRSSHGTGHRERASDRRPSKPSGRGGHAGGGLRQDSRSSSRRESSHKRDCETDGSETVMHQTLSSDFGNEREVDRISISSLSKYSEKRKFSNNSNNETNARSSGDSVIGTSLKRAKIIDNTFPEGSTDVIPAAGNSRKHETSLEMIVKRLTETKSTSTATHAKETKKRRISCHPTCDFCSRKFTKTKERDFHMEHHDEMMYRCPGACGHEFILFKRLQQHSRDNHSVNLTKTDRAKCKIRGRKTTGESNESDSQKSWTSLKKPRKDFRQKRKVFAVSTVWKQCKLNKKSVGKNKIQKKQVVHDVIEGASESNDAPEKCFSLKTVKKEDEGNCGMSKRCPFKNCSFRFENDLRLGEHIREKHTSQLKINRSPSSLTLFNQGQRLKVVKVEIEEPSMEKKPISSFPQEANATKSNIHQGQTTIEQPMNIIKKVSYNKKPTSESAEASASPTAETLVTNHDRPVTVHRDLVTESPTKQHKTTDETINETVSTKLLAKSLDDGSSVDKNDLFEASALVDSKFRNKTAIFGMDGVTGTEPPADIAGALKTTANTDTVDRSTEYSASLELLLGDFVGDETDVSPIQPFIDYSIFMKIRENSAVQSSIDDDRKRELDSPVPNNKMGAQPLPFLVGKEDAMAKKSVPMNVAPSVAGDEDTEIMSYDKTSDEPTEQNKTTESPSTGCGIATLNQTRNTTEIVPISDSITIQDSTKTEQFFDMSALSTVAQMPIIDTVITMTPTIREERLEQTVNANVALEPSEQKICLVHSPDCTEEQTITIDGPTLKLSTWNTESRLSDNSTTVNQGVNVDSEMNTTGKKSVPAIEHSANKRTSVDPPANINEEKESNMRSNTTITESSENSLSPKESCIRDNTAMGLYATTTLTLVPSNRSKLTGMHTYGHTPSESSNLQKTTVKATDLTSVLLEHSYFRPGINEGEDQETMSLIRKKTLTNVNACGKDKLKLSTGTVDLNSLSVQGVCQDPQAEVEVKSEPLTIDMQTIKSEPVDDGDWHFGQREVDPESVQRDINESFLTGEELFVERLSEKFLRWTIKDVAKETLKELTKNKRLIVTKPGKQTEKTNGSVNQTMSRINIKQERNDEDLVSSPSSQRFVTSKPEPSPGGRSVIERKPRSRLSRKSGTKVNAKEKKMRLDVQKGVKYSATDQDGFENVVFPVRLFSASHPSTSLSPGNQKTASCQTLLLEPAVQSESTNNESSPLASPSSPTAQKRLLMSPHGVERSVPPSSSRSTPSPSLLSPSFSHSQEKTKQYDISRSPLSSSPPKLSQKFSPGERTEKPSKQSEASDKKYVENDRTVERFSVASTRLSLPSPSLATQRSGSTTTWSSSDETLPGTTPRSTPTPREMSSVNRRKSVHASPPSCLSSPLHSSSSVASTSRSSPNLTAASIDALLSGLLATLSTKLPDGQREVNGKLKLTLSLKQSSPIKLQYNLRDEPYSPWSLLQNTRGSHSCTSSLQHQNIVPRECLLSETDVTESQKTPFGKKQKSTKVACTKSETNVTEDDSAIDETDECLYSLFLAMFCKMDTEKKSLAKIEIMRILHNLQYETSIPHIDRRKTHCSISGSSTAAENIGIADILNPRNIPCAVNSDAGNSDIIFFRCMVIPVLNGLEDEKKSLAQLEIHKLIHAVRFDER